MKTMQALIGLALALTLLPAALPSPASGQVGMIPEDECRCVDQEGNEVESCRCFRTFDANDLAFSLSPFGDSRARIGITLSTDLREEDARGARVMEVLEGGPADEAGIQEGDVITHLDGRSLLSPLEEDESEEDLDPDASLPPQRLLRLARGLEPGQEVEIRYLREGQESITVVEARELEDPFGALGLLEREWRHDFQDREPRVITIGPRKGRLEIRGGRWFGEDAYFDSCPPLLEEEGMWIRGGACIGGLRVEPLNPRLGEYFGTEVGVLVADVHPDSPLPLEAGDVILRIGERKASDPDRARRILRSYEPQEEITLHIMRRQQELTVTGVLSR